MKKIAIFGGSFDPVHLGHIELVKTAVETVDLQRVIFMPCRQSPFKGKTIATPDQRLDMVQISIEEQGMKDRAEVSDLEINRPGPSYSWQTAEYFSEKFTNIEWHWILGTDQWVQIDQWAEPEKLRDFLKFIVVTRDGDEIQDRPGWRHTAISFSHPASSTKIRSDFSLYKDWLSPGVVDYCKEQSIYS